MSDQFFNPKSMIFNFAYTLIFLTNSLTNS